MSLRDRFEEYRHDIALGLDVSDDVFLDIDNEYVKLINAFQEKHANRPTVNAKNALRYIKFINRLRKVFYDFAG